MPLLRARLRNVGPIDDITIRLDEQVNVFVGANNTGKTIALTALADVLLYPFNLPAKYANEESRFSATVLIQTGEKKVVRGSLPWVWESSGGGLRMLEGLGYGCFVPALRWTGDYRSTGPVGKTTSRPIAEGERPWRYEREMEEHAAEIRNGRYGDVEADDVPEATRRLQLPTPNATLLRDSEIVQLIVELDYRAYREKKPEIRDVIDLVAQVASQITEGYPIAFNRVGEDEIGLFPLFDTPDGPMPLNLLSQGTQSLLQWLSLFILGYSQYYGFPAKGFSSKPGVLLIDEIDAHFHPSWQRRIIPTLTKTFPHLQIICTSHSPLMLSGLKAGQAHLFGRDSDGGVTVTATKDDIVGWTADEILRAYLGLVTSVDIETETRLRRMDELERQSDLSPAEKGELTRLRKTVTEDLTSGSEQWVSQLTARLTDAITSAQIDGG